MDKRDGTARGFGKERVVLPDGTHGTVVAEHPSLPNVVLVQPDAPDIGWYALDELQPLPLPEFEIGVRVMLCGSHSKAGREGVIIGSPARAFNGWTVRLDNGLYVGAGESQMVSERA